MKKEVFIERAVAVHGDKFDYSLLPEDVGWKIKVPVVCKSHGTFHITSGNHISNGRGCAKCGFEYTTSLKINKVKDKFFKESALIHNNKYDYSKVEYKTADTKVVIVCPIHGDFLQRPDSHLRGMGCFQCGREYCGTKQRFSTEDFIARAVEIHGDLYDYSKVSYTVQSEKVEIVCKRHGSFWQQPNNHLTGKNGCPNCLPEKLSEKNRMDQETVRSSILKMLEKDDRKLIEFNYKNSNSFCVVECKKHGQQKQRVRSILSGVGCFKCGVDSSAMMRSKGIDNYLSSLQEKYGDFYDYSEAEFVNSKEKFTVICKVHGQFKTTIANHLKGKGCPKCGSYLTGYRAFRSGSFYVLKITEDVIKFGISNNFENRLKTIKSKCCFAVEPLYVFNFKDGSIPREIESEILGSDILRGVVSPADMKSGYTETCYSSSISFILSIVDKYRDQLS